MGKFIEVAKKSEIADRSAKCVEIEGKRIALFNLGEKRWRKLRPATWKPSPTYRSVSINCLLQVMPHSLFGHSPGLTRDWAGQEMPFG